MGSWLHGTLGFFEQYGVVGLFILSFIEASFFPIPPYLLAVPMTLANPRRGLFYAAVGIAGSVLGGLVGYAIGLRFGRPVLARFLKPGTMAGLEQKFARYGGWAVAAGGLAPMPYKVFAIATGVFRLSLVAFVPASIVARGIRFIPPALLLMFYGRPIARYLGFFSNPLYLTALAVPLLFLAVFRRRLARFAGRLWQGLAFWAAAHPRAPKFNRFARYLGTGAILIPLPWLVPVNGYVLPGGQTLLAMSPFSFLAYLIVRHRQRSFRRNLAVGIMLLLPVLAALGRASLGANHRDFVGGWAGAAAWAAACFAARWLLVPRRPATGEEI